MENTVHLPYANRIAALDRAAWGRILTTVAIVTLSAVIGAIFVGQSPPQPPTPGSDPVLYHSTATEVARLLRADPAALLQPDRPPVILWVNGPLYPLFLALLYAPTGAAHFALAVLVQQVVLLPLTVLFTCFAGRVAFNHRAGALAALALALYLPLVWHANFLFTETWLGFWAALWLLSMAVFLRTRRPPLALFSGLVAGLLGSSHMAWQCFPYVLLGVLVLITLLNRSWRAQWRRTAWAAAGMALALLPMLILRPADLPRATAQLDSDIHSGGWAFYVGSRAETDGLPQPVDYAAAAAQSPQQAQAFYDDVQRGRFALEPVLWGILEARMAAPDPADRVLTDGDFYRAGIINWLNEPLQVPGLLLVKSYRLFFRLYNHNLPETSLYSAALVNFFKSFRLNLPLYGLVGIGLLWVAVRQRDRLLLFLPLALQSLVVIATYPEARYRYPHQGALLLLGALGGLAVLDQVWPPLWRWLNRPARAEWRRWLGVGTALTLIAAAALEFFSPVLLPTRFTYSQFTGGLGPDYVYPVTTSDYLPFTLPAGVSVDLGTGVAHSFNALGYRGPTPAQIAKPAATRRVLLLGDSFTLGWKVAEEHTFAALLRAALAASTPPVEVINAAYHAGQAPDAYYAYLVREGLALEPDVVVFALYSGNDLGDLATNTWAETDGRGGPLVVHSQRIYTDYQGRALDPGALPWFYQVPLLRESRVWLTLADGVSTLINGVARLFQGQDPLDRALARLDEVTQATLALCAEQDIACYVVLMETPGIADTDTAAMDAVLRPLLPSDHYLLLEDVFTAEYLLPEDGHLNEAGHARMAEALLPLIAPALAAE